MVILAAQQIERLALKGFLVLPCLPRTIHATGLSYGISSAGYDIRVREELRVHPGKFVLGSSLECFNMPEHILGVVHDKSTWARQGIALQNTVIEPGWHGFLTMEISNHSDKTITILEGSPIAQVIFHALMEPTDRPYGGKYQAQEAAPVEAKFE